MDQGARNALAAGPYMGAELADLLLEECWPDD